MRIGIVGFGKLAREYYVPALRRIAGVVVEAVADPLPASLEAARCSFAHTHRFVDPQGLFEHGNLDAVLVASPPSTHWAAWQQARRRGLPVFMEKPFPLPEALPALEKERTEARSLMINFNRRRWPNYQQMKDAVRAGWIGHVESAELMLHLDLERWCSVTRHRLCPAEGGPLHDLGSHMVDLTRFLFQEIPVRVQAETQTKRWDSDHVLLRLEMPSGFTVRCDLAYESVTSEQIVVHGSRGRLLLANPNLGVHYEPSSHWSRLGGFCRDVVALGCRALLRDQSMVRFTIRAALSEFFRCVRTHTAFSPDVEDALNVAWVLEAATRSSSTGAPVTVEPSQETARL